MKSLSNKILFYILISAFGFSQYSSPYRFSLKPGNDGEITYFNDGFNSNVVAEIKLMSDSLTWFGTGRGLSLHDGKMLLPINQQQTLLSMSLVIQVLQLKYYQMEVFQQLLLLMIRF